MSGASGSIYDARKKAVVGGDDVRREAIRWSAGSLEFAYIHHVRGRGGRLTPSGMGRYIRRPRCRQTSHRISCGKERIGRSLAGGGRGEGGGGGGGREGKGRVEEKRELSLPHTSPRVTGVVNFTLWEFLRARNPLPDLHPPHNSPHFPHFPPHLKRGITIGLCAVIRNHRSISHPPAPCPVLFSVGAAQRCYSISGPYSRVPCDSSVPVVGWLRGLRSREPAMWREDRGRRRFTRAETGGMGTSPNMGERPSRP